MRWFWQKDKPENQPGSVPASDRVRVFDFDTRQITTMPASELAPGMIRAQMNGVEGEVWVEASRLQKNTYQHPPFSEERRELLRQIKSSLDEVYPMSLDDWEDGFRRDHTPDREIAHWLHLARTYSRLTAPDDSLGSSLERRQGVFQVLVGCGAASREQVLLVSQRSGLSREEAERVITAFYGSPLAS